MPTSTNLVQSTMPSQPCIPILHTGYRTVLAQIDPTLHKHADGCKICNPCAIIAYTEWFGHGTGSATAAAIATMAAVTVAMALAMDLVMDLVMAMAWPHAVPWSTALERLCVETAFPWLRHLEGKYMNTATFFGV